MTDKPSLDSLFSRRRFMSNSAAGLSAAWLDLHWPSVLDAVQHAHHTVNSSGPPTLEFFTPEEAAEVEAITARIIPADDLPGAREAGVVYFIDKALVTFAKDNQQIYRDGLPEIQSRLKQLYPEVKGFSAASPDQQDAVLESFDQNQTSGRRPFRPSAKAPDFFETIRQHTIAGFLIAPDSDRQGNRDGVGWKVIGRETDVAFQPPFGFYDKDYPGWKPAPEVAEKQ